MRVLIYPHDLAIGGSQLNAIELASALYERGHEMVIFGKPGPLIERIRDFGMEFVERPISRRRPSPAVVGALAKLVDDRSIDVIHGYEWPPVLEAAIAATRAGRPVVPVGTVGSMAVAPFIPRSVDLVVGTEQIAKAERRNGRARVTVIEPYVDLRRNHKGVVRDLVDVPARFGISGDRLIVVCVSRLAHQLKLEGLLTAIEVVGELSAHIPVSLLIVGDGPARIEVEAAARHTNSRRGEGTVILAGELADPRPAYAVADVALGMGGSALRAMAFAAPLVVQGENGFWELLSPESVDRFKWTGWYGWGDSPEGGAELLRSILSTVLLNGELRKELGEFALNTVSERYGLELSRRPTADRIQRGACALLRSWPAGDCAVRSWVPQVPGRAPACPNVGQIHCRGFQRESRCEIGVSGANVIGFGGLELFGALVEPLIRTVKGSQPRCHCSWGKYRHWRLGTVSLAMAVSLPECSSPTTDLNGP